MRGIAFDITMRVTGTDVPPASGGRRQCPACAAPLEMHQPDPGYPNRILANCSCEECGVWFVEIATPTRSDCYLVRLPSVIEMVEAISRGDGDGDGDGDDGCRCRIRR